MDYVTVSEKGQITIPQEIRQRLNIAKGDPLIVLLSGDGSIVLKLAKVVPVEVYSKEQLAVFAREDSPTPAEKIRLKKVLGHGKTKRASHIS